MEVTFDAAFLHDVMHAEAGARGLSARLNGLVVARESDGLDGTEALADAAESLGLVADLRDAAAVIAEPLREQEILRVKLEAAHGTMPTLRRVDGDATAAIEPAPVTDVLNVLRALVERMIAEEDRTAVTLPLGLGGSGGCACGDELPEDRAPGPLFQR